MNLTIQQSSSESLVASACDSYEWNGEIYTESGVYTQVFENAAGCDSIVTLILTINNSVEQSLSIVACNSYNLNSVVYNESGVYTQIVETAAGCDSVITLNLTISPLLSTSFSVSACDAYEWNGQIYNASGVYTQALTAFAGCDSLVTLNLTIQSSTVSSINVVGFQQYSANGITYVESGVYLQVLENAAGCDSLITYNVLITQVAGDTNGDGVITDPEVAGDTNGDGSIGDGEVDGDANGDGAVNCEDYALLGTLNESMQVVSCGPYMFNNLVFAETGVYMVEFVNGQGCQAMMTLDLEIIKINTSVEHVQVMLTAMQSSGVTYQWIDCANNSPIAGATGQSFIPAQNGLYAVQISTDECSVTTECVEFNDISIDQVDSVVLMVYPNPSMGEFMVRLGAQTNVNYELLDARGRLVEAGRWTTIENMIDLSGESSGVYMLRVDGQNFRLVKQ